MTSSDNQNENHWNFGKEVNALVENKKKRTYMRYDEAQEYYGVSRNTLTKWAHNAKAERKIEKVCLLNINLIDEYIESFADTFELY